MRKKLSTLSRNKKLAAGVLLIGLFAIGTTNPVQSNQKQAANLAGTTSPAQEIRLTEKQELKQVTTKTVTETKVMPYNSQSEYDPAITQGQRVVVIAGQEGELTTTYTVTLKDGIETGRTKVKETITKTPVSEHVKIGSKPAPAQPAQDQPAAAPSASANNRVGCDPNYIPCIPNVGYDLDCRDVGIRVTVIGIDRHGLDGNDNDGIGCESY